MSLAAGWVEDRSCSCRATGVPTYLGCPEASRCAGERWLCFSRQGSIVVFQLRLSFPEMQTISRCFEKNSAWYCVSRSSYSLAFAIITHTRVLTQIAALLYNSMHSWIVFLKSFIFVYMQLIQMNQYAVHRPTQITKFPSNIKAEKWLILRYFRPRWC